jgi:hypothetical protein
MRGSMHAPSKAPPAATFTLAHLQEGRRAQRCWINLTAPLSPSLTLRPACPLRVLGPQDIGVVPKTVVVDLGFRGVDATVPDVQLLHRGKSRSLTAQQLRWVKRRQACGAGDRTCEAGSPDGSVLAAGCDGRCAARGAVCRGVQHPVAAAGVACGRKGLAGRQVLHASREWPLSSAPAPSLTPAPAGVGSRHCVPAAATRLAAAPCRGSRTGRADG